LKYWLIRKSLSKSNGSKRKPEPELTKVQVPGVQKWGFERRGEGNFGIQRQEGQELTTAATGGPHCTEE
jgi:hypothetical protein